MQDNLFEKVRCAIKESQVARDAFTSAMNETSEKLGYADPKDRDTSEVQTFGKPADESSIQELEGVLNMVLPPSYRKFLLNNDGWEVIDGSQSFFSIDQLLAWRSRKDPSGWIDIAKQYGDEFVESCLVIGASDDSPDKYLLNPNVIDENSEWQFIEFFKDGHEVYESFLDYLVSTKEQFYESAKEIDFDEYFDPFDEE
jgi:cell wall assembly regulator SMI1